LSKRSLLLQHDPEGKDKCAKTVKVNLDQNEVHHMIHNVAGLIAELFTD
jgi:hypothetical protein